MFTLIHNSSLTITFDPISVVESYPWVSFEITVKWTMARGDAQIIVNEYWFEFEELNRFEKELLKFANRQTETAVLDNMSSQSIIVFTRNDLNLDFEFIITNSTLTEAISSRKVLSRAFNSFDSQSLVIAST